MLTRTDFLLQFVWKPAKPEDCRKLPKKKRKLADEEKKLTEAEKTNAGDTVTAKLEETIEAESLRKSEQLDSQLDKAFNGPGAAGSSSRRHSRHRPHAADGRPAQGRSSGIEVISLFHHG